MLCVFKVQYNLLTPPCTEPGSVQEGGKRSSLPLHYGFKEVEENWAKHCSAGKNIDWVVVDKREIINPRICIET